MHALFRGASVIPVLTIEREQDALPLARALAEGGLNVIEVALRTPVATAAIAAIARELPHIIVGAGTLQRAADVTLKERRPLVVVPREAPYTRATLAHMLTLHDAGAVVLPASPAFYSAPQTVAQLVDFVAAKVLDAIGVEHDLITRWTGRLGAARALDE